MTFWLFWFPVTPLESPQDLLLCWLALQIFLWQTVKWPNNQPSTIGWTHKNLNLSSSPLSCVVVASTTTNVKWNNWHSCEANRHGMRHLEGSSPWLFGSIEIQLAGINKFAARRTDELTELIRPPTENVNAPWRHPHPHPVLIKRRRRNNFQCHTASLCVAWITGDFPVTMVLMPKGRTCAQRPPKSYRSFACSYASSLV